MENANGSQIQKNICTHQQLRKLIEQRFAIIISNAQFDRLIQFLNQNEDMEKKGLVDWSEMLKKFSEIK